MALLGKAILGVWNEVAPSDEADFAGWYVREHLPERTSVPGMPRGRKYRAIENASPANMALYEAADLDVLTSGAYRTQLDNPTAWTARITARFTFMRRAICSVIADAGAGVGGFATVYHFHPAPDADARVRVWAEKIVSELVEMPQIVAAHCWVGAAGEPETPTSRLSAAAVAEKPVGWVLAIEAAGVAALKAAQARLNLVDIAATGIADWQPYPLYALSYVLTAG